jgi:hypothetical protein
LPLLLKIGLGYTVRKVKENQEGLEFCETRQLPVCADHVNLLSENDNSIKKNI